MKVWYEDIRERFLTFPIETQVLHLAGELNKAKNRGPISKKEAEAHLYGALVLIDHMVADTKWVPRRKELLRLREAVASLLAPGIPYGTIAQLLEVALLLDPGAYKMGRATIGR